MIALDPIGYLRTPFETHVDAPRQGTESDARGTIVLEPAYEPGLAGLRAGDDVEVLWLAHRADRSALRVRDGERGVFATRSQDRPNPICLTRCPVLAVEGRRVSVAGVDALDDSPVLDLKAPLR
ncbi:SAM-dependent methyltransferase [Halovivax sp.]|uniref:SAM-dependent methyltransferase n=1 Tax=Halovivax sp. TaxID=1935978 RepID=UPI0025C648A5|nr:SAM-dependent methyltransferase [Halovivax sp.]